MCFFDIFTNVLLSPIATPIKMSNIYLKSPEILVYKGISIEVYVVETYTYHIPNMYLNIYLGITESIMFRFE